jgi:hypothetical protein
MSRYILCLKLILKQPFYYTFSPKVFPAGKGIIFMSALLMTYTIQVHMLFFLLRHYRPNINRGEVQA